MNWQTVGSRLAPILVLIFGLGTIISLVVIYRVRRTAKATAFGFVREQSTLAAKRLLVLAVVLAVLAATSGALWGVSVQRPDLLPTVPPTATQTAIPSPTPRTPTATATSTHTPTATPTPTQTLISPGDAGGGTSTWPSALLTPFPVQAVTPGPNAVLVDLVLASGEQNSAPISPGSNFPPGTEQVYAFFTFEGMARNVPWAHAWYVQVDGQMVEYWSSAELWSYDSARSTVWRYINSRPGKYELHIYIGHGLQQKVPFTVQASE